jgi:putative endonuclease
MAGGWAYMMADRYRGAIYTGITSNLPARIDAHRNGHGSKFCAQYGLKRLVFAEHFDRIDEAIAAEKATKKWRRAWKIELIERTNPDWDDLYEMLNW